jgi:hypothetical protein
MEVETLRRGDWVRPARVLKTCLPAVVCEGGAESIKLKWQRQQQEYVASPQSPRPYRTVRSGRQSPKQLPRRGKTTIAPGETRGKMQAEKSGATTDLNQGISDPCTAKNILNKMSPDKRYGPCETPVK